MRISTVLSFPLFLLAASAELTPVNYDNTKVIRVRVGGDSQLNYFDATIRALGLSTWSSVHKPNTLIDVQVPPSLLTQFDDAFNGWGTQVIHEDLGASIRAESEVPKQNPNTKVADDWFDSFHSYADHQAWLQELIKTYPNNAQSVSSGKSAQGQDITGVHIYGSKGPGGSPAIIFHGTVHAREWIATMVTEYMAYTLLSTYSSNTETKSFVDSFDFYIFPVVNPDGFVYTQTVDRLWRKNRQNNTNVPVNPIESTVDCNGRDINRNWPWQWNVTQGASDDPCAETYRGVTPGDGVETAGLSKFLNDTANSPSGALMYVDWHSYSQLFMYPYGYSCQSIAANSNELDFLVKGFATEAAKPYNTTFTTGPICTTIYLASGTSTDYAYDVSKIKYSFAAELRDQGQFGFVLPPAQIRPSSEEVWDGVKFLLTNLKGKDGQTVVPSQQGQKPSGASATVTGGLWIMAGIISAFWLGLF